MRFLWAAMAMLTTLFAVSAQASSVEALQRFLAPKNGFQADFYQRVSEANGETSSVSRGTVALKQGERGELGRFSWHYQEPWAQIIVGDGRNLWQYDADLEQVTVRPMQESLAGTPAELLAGNLDVDAWDFSSQDGWLNLHPMNNDLPFKLISLQFDMAEVLVGMRLVDQFEQTTTVLFENISTQPQFAAEQFVFSPPPGTEVVGEPQ